MAIVAKYLFNGGVSDLLGNYNGTNTGGTFNNNKFSQCISYLNNFDTKTQYTTIGTGVVSNNMSLDFFARTNASTSKWYMLPFDYESAGQIHTRITFGNTAGTPNRVELRVGASSPSVATTGDILKRDNTWQYWGFSRSLSGSTYTVKIYLNGVEVASASANSTSLTPSGNSPTIGANSAAGGGFTGDIENLTIDNTALNGTDFKNRYLFYNGFI